MGFLALRGIRKLYGEVVAVDSLDLDVARGEFVVLVGPSGCGKTTALRIVAGLESPTAGSLELDSRDITLLSPRQRDVAMVFQNYALYPHMNVRRNLSFGLRMRRAPRAAIEERVGAVARTLGIDGLLDRYPAQLSGGQRQRVALGRAIIREPKLFLMDEPLSNLDAELRVSMRAELLRLHGRLGVTTLYVTHDQVEAMTLGDRLVVLNHGRPEQVGSPAEVYRRPRTLFVARFLGSPPINVLDAEARAADGGLEVALGERALSVPGGRLDGAASSPAAGAVRVRVGVRPEAVRVLEPAAAATPGAGADAPGSLPGVVELVEHLGKEKILFVRCRHASVGEAVVEAIVPASDARGKGDGVVLEVAAKDLHLFDPETGRSLLA